jgi:hypothetical protein
MRDDEANNKGRSVGNLPRKKLVKFSKGKISIPSRRQILLPCPYYRRTNHAEKDCWFKGKPSLQCVFCNNLGHSGKFCRIKKKQSQQQIQQQANVSEEGKDDEEHLFMASQASNTSELNTWLIDSGCTSHISKFLSIFSSIDRSVQPKIKLGNGDIVQAKGKGTVAVNINRGIKTITNVLYIPELDQNLLSVAQMFRNGYEVFFKERFCFITDTHDSEITKIKMDGNSFYLKLDAVKGHVFSAKIDENILWHKRFGHYNLKSLKLLYDTGMVKNMSEIYVTTQTCGSCELGKQHRQPFPKGISKRATHKLELVHSDICGPMSTASLSNNMYFILFIDDFSRMTWVYFLKLSHKHY